MSNTEEPDSYTGTESAEQRQKIEEIVKNGLAQCYRRETIIKLIVEYCPRVSRAVANGWISRILKSIARSDAKLLTDVNINRGLYLLRLEQAYAMAVERGDIKTAITAASAIAEAQGLKATTGTAGRKLVQNNVDKSTTNILHVTPESLEDLNELSDAQITQALNRKEVTPKQAAALVAASEGDYSMFEQAQEEPELVVNPQAYEGTEDSSLGYPDYMYLDDPLAEES